MIKELGLAYYRLPVEEDAVFPSSVFDVVNVLQSSVVPAVASPNAHLFARRSLSRRRILVELEGWCSNEVEQDDDRTHREYGYEKKQQQL
ncbi:unnamed protein product [Sphagnum balticum]